MKLRPFISGLFLAACLVMLGAAGLQRGQLLNLRAEQQRKLPDATAPTDVPPSAPDRPVVPSPSLLRELLQLRNQVAQLRRRREELLPVRAEHEYLVVQLAARGTNALHLPPNYIRQAQARLVGYNTLEDTLQSFLYAVRSRDVTNLLQALTPEAVSQLKSQLPLSSDRLENFFEGSQALIGLSIVAREQQQPDVIAASVQVLPGLPATQIVFRLINSQWKMDGLP